MKMDLEVLAEAYLDGLLQPQEAAAFEEALLTEEGSEALSQALMFRYLMKELLPEQAEPELVDAIHAAIMEELGQREEAQSIGLIEQIRRSLQPIGYAFSGPRAALHGVSIASQDLRDATKSTQPFSSSLEKMQHPIVKTGKKLYQKRQPIWKLALRMLRR